MSWTDYLATHIAGRTQVSVADALGVSGTAISRWLKGTQGVSAGQAINFARVVGRPPLEALIAAGYLTSEEAGERPTAALSLSQLTDDALLAEVRARMSRQERDGDDAAPTSNPGLSAVPDRADTATTEDIARMAAYRTPPERPFTDQRPDDDDTGEESQLPPEDDDEGR